MMMKRLFAAIDIIPDENFLKIYFDLTKRLHFANINWVKPENMHLTVKFFGETPVAEIEKINKVISETTANHKGFNFEIKNTGIFGSKYKAKVIWFGTEKSEVLKSLAENLHVNLDKNGFLQDRQNFVPHITLGRIKDVQNKKRFQAEVDEYKNTFVQKVLIDSIILYESLHFSPDPQYKKINEFKLTH